MAHIFFLTPVHGLFLYISRCLEIFNSTQHHVCNIPRLDRSSVGVLAWANKCGKPSWCYVLSFLFYLK